MELYSAKSAKYATVTGRYFSFKKELEEYSDIEQVCRIIKFISKYSKYFNDNVTILKFKVSNNKLADAKEAAKNLRELGYECYVVGNKMIISWSYDLKDYIRELAITDPTLADTLSQMLSKREQIDLT